MMKYITIQQYKDFSSKDNHTEFPTRGITVTSKYI
jgi:hypothetical protein